MDPKIKNWLGLAGLAAIVIIALSGVRFVGAYANATDPASRFAVTGDAKVNVVPDVAEFSFGVVTEGGRDVAALQKQNTDKSNAAIDYLKSQGIEAKDIETENYNVQPRYTNVSCGPGRAVCPPAEIAGYTVSQMVRVKVRDFSKTGDLISGVTERGANNVSGLVFTIDDEDDARNEARGEAIKEAREKAEELARAGGFRLGRLISIDEGGAYPPIPYYAKTESQAMDLAGRGAASAPAIEPGSDDVNVTVTLTYAIR